ncbi:MAG: hypothetical protein WA125_17465 [Desulfosporosinus sp.]
MIYGFDTSNESAALGSLLVFGIYRSRDVRRFKVTPEMWSQIERACKSSAKRAEDLTDFIEKLKPKLMCGTVAPRYMKTDLDAATMYVDHSTGEVWSRVDDGKRQFWTRLLEESDDQIVLETLYRKTSLIIALVRDRLEREKPIEAQLYKDATIEDVEWKSVDKEE